MWAVIDFGKNFPYNYSEELEQLLSNTMYCESLYMLAPMLKEFYIDETSKKRMARESQKRFNDRQRKAIARIAKEWLKKATAKEEM